MLDFESDFTRNKVKQALLPMGYATEGLLDEIDRIYLAAHTSSLASIIGSNDNTKYKSGKEAYKHNGSNETWNYTAEVRNSLRAEQRKRAGL